MPLTLRPTSSILDLDQLGKRSTMWELHPESMARVESAYNRLNHELETSSKPIYGLHTSFGNDVRQTVSPTDWINHQTALLNYLKVGVGPSLTETVVRRALRLQAYKTSLGVSGIHPKTWSNLVALCDQPEMPKVPSLGSLGASGDLIPMAHSIAPLFEHAAPLGPRDVISLVNTNAIMASLAVECWQQTWSIYQSAHVIWLLATRALSGQKIEGLSEGLNSRLNIRQFRNSWLFIVDQLQSQVDSYKSSTLSVVTTAPLQERYSIRCAPQILMDLGENLLFAARKIEEEALGVADNPLVLPSGIWHGGHFYASGLATAADLMSDAIGRIADMIDRQVLLLVTPELSHGLSANLSIAPGDHVKGLHQLASSLLQSIKAHSLPSRMLSFSSESHNQDVVPASMVALLQVKHLGELGQHILKIGTFVSERAYLLRYGLPLAQQLKLSQWDQHETLNTWQRLNLVSHFDTLVSDDPATC